MHRLCVVAALTFVLVLALATAGISYAQDASPDQPAAGAGSSLGSQLVTAEFAASRAVPAAEVAPALGATAAEGASRTPGSTPAPAALPATPQPKFAYGSRNDFRWQLALGIALVRFRSPFYYATAVGVNTSVTFFANDWLGVEGALTTAFAPPIYVNEHVKYAGYGGGPKIAWRGRKWEPWAHAIVGGLHIVPKPGDQSETGFELLVGGGADYRIYPHLSARVEVDWLKTHVFGAWENSGQANANIVLHF